MHSHLLLAIFIVCLIPRCFLMFLHAFGCVWLPLLQLSILRCKFQVASNEMAKIKFAPTFAKLAIDGAIEITARRLAIAASVQNRPKTFIKASANDKLPQVIQNVRKRSKTYETSKRLKTYAAAAANQCRRHRHRNGGGGRRAAVRRSHGTARLCSGMLSGQYACCVPTSATSSVLQSVLLMLLVPVRVIRFTITIRYQPLEATLGVAGRTSAHAPDEEEEEGHAPQGDKAPSGFT